MAAIVPCPRVYVVDDDHAVRAAVSMLIHVSGWQPVSCASAEDFLERYEPGLGQCVILDICMPGLSGTQLQARLRECGDTVPIIIVTGQHDGPQARIARDGGALAVLAKPFQGDELLSWVARALGG